MDEIIDPRVYSKALQGAGVKIGGEAICDIPFRHAPAAITTIIHQITQGTPPAALMAPEFESYRTGFRKLGQELRDGLDKGERPDPATVKKALEMINAAEAKADEILPRNGRERNDPDKYLKSLHGLIGMLQPPALKTLLSGLDKHPEATLGQLLVFMNSFNLRFGPAKTPRQQAVYDRLYPMLVELRDKVASELTAGAPALKAQDTAPGDFFGGMSYQDLQKMAPPPPSSGSAPR